MTLDPSRTTYRSEALSERDFACVKALMLQYGWEYLPARNGIVYTRKHLCGPINTLSKGWLSV